MSSVDPFAAFWQAYPRRVAKKAAEKAWAKVALNPQVIDEIMTGLRAQLPLWKCMIMNDQTRFIPHPSTWLNQQRFEDEQVSKPLGPRIIACQKCADTGQILVGPPALEIRRCSCVAGDRVIVLSQIHPDDWAVYVRDVSQPERDAP